MPRYKLKCREVNCQKEFESLTPTTNGNRFECPICGSTSVEKVPAQFHFIGKKTKGKLNK